MWITRIFAGSARAKKAIQSAGFDAQPRLIDDNAASDQQKTQGDLFLDQGNWEMAAACYREAIAKNPGNANAHNNLGLALSEQHQYDAANTHLGVALSLNPQLFNAHYILGTIARNSGDPDQAIEHFERAVATKPDFTEALDCLGLLYRQRGELQKCIDCYRRALAIDPLSADTHSSLLFSLQFDSTLAPGELYAEHLRFAQRFELPLSGSRQAHTNDKSQDRRLKIGYVSGDFIRHPVALFMLPVLANHDKAQFEIYCYFNFASADDLTEHFVALSDHFIPCSAMTDEELAERIRSDGIDILVDLAGHTGRNRLLTFARKPAPVQLTYLGYVDTTGLSSIDYRLTNTDADPPENDLYNSERLYRFTDSLWWAYQPAPDLPEVSALPALANGFVTFSSNNQIAKISLSLLNAWAEILHSVANSRLVIMGISSDGAERKLQQQFAALGVAPERLTFRRFAPLDEYRRQLLQTDISLDSFPYNGGTTSCESLWLGLPLITLKGQSFVSRMGFALLTAIGLPELTANNYAEYVDIAVRLARDLEKLSALRHGLRERVAKSCLSDASGFTLSLESAYRTMWREYASKAQAADF
jgi:predicted O-linked N-acetylglucosamine transferase (SPINDLY family)